MEQGCSEIFQAEKEGNLVMRIIKSMEEKYLVPALELVEGVFTDSECAENGKLVITGLPALAPDPLATVIKVEFEDVPRRMEETDLASWIGNIK